MLQVSEAIIRNALDGTFTRLDPTWGVVTSKVSKKFIPLYGHVFIQTPRTPTRARPPKRTPFSDIEDNSIIDMVRSGKRIVDIAYTINRQYASVQARITLLIEQGYI